ncbi:DinB family protein [Alkalihalobacillus sp. 1P02AB]|uniref:DinB family protein n=1 Tax=Alkalihalobacillus sp. 1P02AB TaxID=3132260 RepID=UPI0039A7556F
MIPLFEYNWQIRDEWFRWCQSLSVEQLTKRRVGGVGSILATLFHVAEVENSWLRAVQGKEDIIYDAADYPTLDAVKRLSDQWRAELVPFILNEMDSRLKENIYIPWEIRSYQVADIIHHILTHEIHHIGQLSIWARELKMDPVQAHFLGRRLNSLSSY